MSLEHCQNGRMDICLAGQYDGVCCADGECDIEDEIRKNPERFDIGSKVEWGDKNRTLTGEIIGIATSYKLKGKAKVLVKNCISKRFGRQKFIIGAKLWVKLSDLREPNK